MNTAFRKVMLKYMILDCNFNNKQKKTNGQNVCQKNQVYVWLAKSFFEKCLPGAGNALQTKKSLWDIYV